MSMREKATISTPSIPTQGLTVPADAAVARLRMRAATLATLHRVHNLAVALKGDDAGTLDTTARTAFGSMLDNLRREAISQGLDPARIEAESIARSRNVPDEGEPVVADCD